jgi:hypothetical protein
MGRVPARLVTLMLEWSFSPIFLSSIGAQAGGNIGFDVSSSRERLFVRTARSDYDIESDPCGSSQLNHPSWISIILSLGIFITRRWRLFHSCPKNYFNTTSHAYGGSFCLDAFLFERVSTLSIFTYGRLSYTQIYIDIFWNQGNLKRMKCLKFFSFINQKQNRTQSASFEVGRSLYRQRTSGLVMNRKVSGP